MLRAMKSLTGGAATLAIATALLTSGIAQRTDRGGRGLSRPSLAAHRPEGNRVTAAAGIPGDPLTYYVGSASVESSRPAMVV
jgi:hypothetical protein